MMRYSTAETALARMYGADEVQAKAFRGRLKHLKRLGVPLGSRPGKGSKIWYRDEDVWQWAFCLELAEFGIDPTVVVEFTRKHWTEICHHFKAAENASGDNELFFHVRPHMMSSAWSDRGKLEFRWASYSEACREVGRYRRIMLINISAMLRELAIQRTFADTTNPIEREA